MLVPAGQMNVARARARDGLVGVLALELVGEAADEHQRRALGEALTGLAVGLDQQRDPLDAGEAPDVEQHRAVVAGERRDVLGPVGAAVDLARLEAPGIEAVGNLDALLVRHAEQALGAGVLAAGEHQQALATRRPAAQALHPGRRVRPALRLGLDGLEHQQLGAVEVADDGHVGRDAGRGLVEGGEVMEMQHVGVTRPGGLQRARPRGHEVVGDVVAERGEDAVGRAGSILEGGVEGRVGEQRVGGVEGGGEVDGMQVEAAVERPCVAGAPGAARASRTRSRPPSPRAAARWRGCGRRAPSPRGGRT